MKLNPNIIPHRDFHKGIWIRTYKCPWFFFLETDRTYDIPKSPNFYNTVDDNLKEIVKFLHSKNISTTPSCSGHIRTSKDYGKIYHSIENIVGDIKKDGIRLLDPETNGLYFYKNNKFKIPWSKYEFLEDMEDYQKRGVLGFVDKFDLGDRLGGEIKIDKDGDIILIHTKGNSESEINKKWGVITKIIKNFL